MPPEELVDLTVDLLRRNGFRQDTYIRPTLYKSSEIIGVRLHDLEQQLLIFAVPFGEYIAIDRGITAQVVSWRRNSDQALPARSKIVGAYVNSAFSKTEAVLNGYDEAIVLTHGRPRVGGQRREPVHGARRQADHAAVSDDILEGITRTGLIELARKEMGIETIAAQRRPQRAVRGEEVFLCGTGAQISPVVEIDHRQRRQRRGRPHHAHSSRRSTSTWCAAACPPTATG